VSAVSVLIFTVSALLGNNGESALHYRCNNVYRRDTEREREKKIKRARARERKRERERERCFKLIEIYH